MLFTKIQEMDGYRLTQTMSRFWNVWRHEFKSTNNLIELLLIELLLY